MTSFDAKVEALRRLQEKRLARQTRERETAETPSGVQAAESEDAVQKPSVVETSIAGSDLDGRELTSVLERYARLQGPAKVSPPSEGYETTAPATALKENTGDEADALYCLGHCLEEGLHEHEKDQTRAAVYYRMAAEKGSVVAQWRLGHIHEYGAGVEANGEWAAQWYRLAAEAGHPQSQTSLALLLEDGRAGPRDDAEALRWHLAAAEQNQALSQYCAACCLAEGRGAAQDEATSRTLLEKSAAAGFPLAVEALAGGKLWNHADPDSDESHEDDVGEEVAEGTSGQSLIDIAARVAKQISHLSDTDANAFLEELMNTFDDDTMMSFDLEALQEPSDLHELGTPEPMPLAA